MGVGVLEIEFGAVKVFPVDHPAADAVGAGVVVGFGVAVGGTEFILLIETGAGAAPGAGFVGSEGPIS